MDRRTGRAVWTARVGPGAGDYYFHGNPLVTAETVVIGADTGGLRVGGASVHAFDRATGRERWRHPAGPGVAGAIAGWGPLAYAAGLDGRLVALDVESGSVRWSFAVTLWGWEGPAVQGDRVFAGARDGTLHALDARTGRVVWQVKFDSGISTSVIATPTGLYLGTSDGTMHRMEAASGKVLASLRLDDRLRPRGVPVATDRAVLVLLADPRGAPAAVVSLDLRLSRVGWRQAGAAPWTTARVFVHDTLALVGTESGDVFAYCLADGRLSGSRHVGGFVRSIGGSADQLYVGTSEGVLRAFPPWPGCR